MATTKEYWQAADFVHDTDALRWKNAPVGWSHVKRFCVTPDMPLTGRIRLGGFQAACYQKQVGGVREAILAIAGTQGLSVSDILADLKIVISMMPRQATSAERPFRACLAKGLGADEIVVVGHSLGGALAQVLGFWHNVRFLTFNAPGMYHVVAGSMANVFKPVQMFRTIGASAKTAWKAAHGTRERGINLVIKGDLIGNAGPHVGDKVKIAANGTSGAFGSHRPDAIKAALKGHLVGGQRLWDLDPFTVL